MPKQLRGLEYKWSCRITIEKDTPRLLCHPLRTLTSLTLLLSKWYDRQPRSACSLSIEIWGITSFEVALFDASGLPCTSKHPECHLQYSATSIESHFGFACTSLIWWARICKIRIAVLWGKFTCPVSTDEHYCIYRQVLMMWHLLSSPQSKRRTPQQWQGRGSQGRHC